MKKSLFFRLAFNAVEFDFCLVLLFSKLTLEIRNKKQNTQSRPKTKRTRQNKKKKQKRRDRLKSHCSICYSEISESDHPNEAERAHRSSRPLLSILNLLLLSETRVARIRLCCADSLGEPSHSIFLLATLNFPIAL